MTTRWNRFAVMIALTLLALTSRAQAAPKKLEKATFGSGCFWCIQPPFDKTPGVINTVVGYTGGHVEHPTYHEVGSGSTGHAESIEVTYDPSKVTYEQLLDVFWHNINPTQEDQQFPDWGTQYRTAIFYHNAAQQKAAIASKEFWQKDGRFGGKIVTEIVPATTFWPAEEYHQKYYLKSSGAYDRYHDNSGRTEYFQKTWSSK